MLLYEDRVRTLVVLEVIAALFERREVAEFDVVDGAVAAERVKVPLPH